MSLTGKTIGELALLSGITDNTLFAVELSGVTYYIPYSGLTNYKEVTYSELYNSITGETLTPGTFYLITDFRTCYDQPDFYFNTPIIVGNYKESAIEPIIVFATSVSTISIDAYQPTYPKDKIQYDWTFNTTEVTSGTSYGRITERIDEFNNRTDYDHRTILFKRYRLFTYRQDQPLNGTIELFNDGSVSGTGTSFDLLNVGDVIYVPSITPSFYEITGITDNTSMAVSGDTLGVDGGNLGFYLGIEETNDSGGYFGYTQTNIKTNDFREYTTFGDAILTNLAKNNYIGNYANNYVNISSGVFMLANNVFLEGQYESNTYGDSCFNNTFGTDNQNNIWGTHCYQNVSINDIDNNIIGHYFSNNIITDNLVSNIIGNNFQNNRLLSGNNESFRDNNIQNNFNDNLIYSWFHDNTIGNNFNNNIIGDFGNLTNFNFSNNKIGDDFYQNKIKSYFYVNLIGNQFNNNTINGEFGENVIGNYFAGNVNIGYNFYNNNIGGVFSNNELIGDYFQDNQIDNYFEGNSVSTFFKNNQIKNSFANNTLGNSQYFNWDDTSIENLTGRTYDTFYNSLYGDGGNNVGNIILGKELIMRDTANNEYHKVKFTQWTQNNNGGGFSYERTKVYPTIEPTVYFTKTNNGPEVDVIVEGSLEIRRGNNGAIYNSAEESNWNSGQSPVGTQWNSIYTEPNNGERFTYNEIGNDFSNNNIGKYFGYDDNENVGDKEKGNKIGNDFKNNTIVSTMFNNVIGNYFYSNTVGEYFYNNTIVGGFYNNQVFNYFQMNNIKFNLFSTDFTEYYGQYSAFTYVSIGSTATDNSYTNLTGLTNGIGIDAAFNATVSGGTVVSVDLDDVGKYYEINDTITILGTQIGGTDGVDDIVVTITGVTPVPTVYEQFNCELFKNSANNSRLSYYDASDILTIKNIND